MASEEPHRKRRVRNYHPHSWMYLVSLPPWGVEPLRDYPCTQGKSRPSTQRSRHGGPLWAESYTHKRAQHETQKHRRHRTVPRSACGNEPHAKRKNEKADRFFSGFLVSENHKTRKKSSFFRFSGLLLLTEGSLCAILELSGAMLNR